MKANELRIGNLVYAYKGIWSIDSTDFARPEVIGTYRPIGLTEEWLVKFGFEKDSDGIYKDLGCLYWLTDGRLQIALDYAPVINAPCKYVHQLQNLYFALTGEELTIKT